MINEGLGPNKQKDRQNDTHCTSVHPLAEDRKSKLRSRLAPPRPRSRRTATVNAKVGPDGMRNPGNQERKKMALEHEALTERIIGAAIEVHRRLGPGFANRLTKRP